MSNVITPDFVINYPKILKPELNKMNGKMEYSAVAVFPIGTNLTKLEAAAVEACETKWGKDKAKWPKPSVGKVFGTPFRKQEDRMKEDEATGKKFLPAPYKEGGIYMNLKTDRKPAVVDQNVQPILEANQIYSGVVARASLRFFAYATAGNVGVSAGLVNIQKVSDGEPLGGVMRAEDEFAPIAQDTKAGAQSLFS